MKSLFKIQILLLSIFAQDANAQFDYPLSKEIPVLDDYFGTQITDNYRWLENLNDTAVQQWVKKQSDFSNAWIDKISGKEILMKRLKEYQEMSGDLFGKIVQNGSTYYYAKTPKGQNLSKLYSRSLPNGKEVLVFDPENVGSKTQLIDFIVSEKGDKLAMKLSSNGAEICYARIMDLKAKKLFSDNFGPIWSEFPIQFVTNSTEIIYTKMKSTDNKSDDVLKHMDVYLHKIGTQNEKDLLIFSREKYKELNVLPERFPVISVSDDNKYLFLRIGSVKNEQLVYFTSIQDLRSHKIKWKLLMNDEDKITQYYTIGNQLYFLTHKNASRFKIGVTNMLKPNFDDAKIIVPESNNIIANLQKTKNYLVYTLSTGLTKDKYTINSKTFEIKKLDLPGGTNGSAPFNSALSDRLIIYNTNWLSPYALYEFDIDKNIVVKSKWFDMSGQYPDYLKDFVIKEVEVKSYDGVMVPLSIIYPQNLPFDGTAPCYISGYGSYGRSLSPNFIDALAILLEQGCCVAFAHVRGGGEKGKEWHKGGMKETKPNTWKDFIACTEYLVSEKYTSPNKIIGNGVSAGGILIGRAITERPDLYGVAIVEVGMTNVLRNEMTSNGNNQIPEIGSVKVERDIKHLIEMDVQSKVRKGINYPAVFIRSGMNDARVSPWMPAKLGAILQNSSSSKKPVLLYVNYGNGHFTSDINEMDKEFADMFAFALWQVKHPKFTVME